MGKTHYGTLVSDTKLLVPGTADPTELGELTYVIGTGFRAYGNAGIFTIPTSGGGGTGGGLESAYSVGGDENDIQVDEGAVTWTDSTTGALNTIEYVKDGAGSGNLLDLAIDAASTGAAIGIDMNLGIAAEALFIDNGGTARTGSDILVTDDSTGNHSVIDINSSGAGATVGFDFTGSYTGSPAGQAMKITMDANDNLDTEIMQVDTGAGARGIMFDLNFGHTDAGTTSHIFDIDIGAVIDSNIFDVAYASTATGNTFFVNLDNAVAATAVHIEGSGVRTEPMFEIATDCTGAADLVDIAITGVMTGNVIDIDCGAAITGVVIDIDMNLGVAAKAINIDGGGGTRTADLITITHDGDGDVDVFNIAASNTGSGTLFDINMNGTATGSVMNVDMNLAVGAAYLALDAGGGTRTVDLIDVTFDGDGDVGIFDIDVTNTGSGNLVDIDVSGLHTGNAIDITYSAAASTGDAISVVQGTNVAGSALLISGTGIRTDDLIKIDTDATGTAHVIDLNVTGAMSGNAVDVTLGATTTGSAIVATHSGDAYVVDITGNKAAASQAVARITATATDGAALCLELDQDDVDVGFLTFTGTAGSGNSIDSDDKSGGTGVYIKIDINGTDYWILATPSA